MDARLQRILARQKEIEAKLKGADAKKETPKIAVKPTVQSVSVSQTIPTTTTSSSSSSSSSSSPVAIEPAPVLPSVNAEWEALSSKIATLRWKKLEDGTWKQGEKRKKERRKRLLMRELMKT